LPGDRRTIIQLCVAEGRPKDQSFGRPSATQKVLLVLIPGDKSPGYYRDVPPGQQVVGSPSTLF